MKILLIIGDITLKGGAERVVSNLANLFYDKGLDVEILSFYKKNEKSYFFINPDIKISFFHQKGHDEIKKGFYKLVYKYYESFIIKNRYKDKDYIIYNNCTQFPFFKNKNTRYLKIQHSKLKILKRDKFFDTLIILSSKELNIWKKYYKDVRLIPNFLSSLPKENANLEQKIILSIGRMTNEDTKGFFRLLDIWKVIQKENSGARYRLHIVGEGEAREKLLDKIKQEKIENVMIKPFVKEIEKEYLSASIYAMASYFEGLPMSLLEASSFALPCIAFDVNSGPSDIIEDGKSGFLIKDGDLKEFALKLQLLMNDLNLRKSMGQKAKELIELKFSKEVVFKKWQENLS
ncbi:glycosyltransferase family 4 protein [Campylobacter novaezeelandiae]|uniref:Glycosyltransferase family 4 protein n=1 Tax=Campylobacter novaezeelandiae TaxID=2267891 RepID=A0A4V2JQC6_9BACT|nr:glycosyltransferase family 4 protein [Campylobacter novaezeelandiae]TBR78395.1 glycosyltransferase family 4 protein [Campylobacter novaezeelandiae]